VGFCEPGNPVERAAALRYQAGEPWCARLRMCLHFLVFGHDRLPSLTGSDEDCFTQ